MASTPEQDGEPHGKAQALAEAGCEVIVNGRDAAGVEATAKAIAAVTGAKVVAALGVKDAASLGEIFPELIDQMDAESLGGAHMHTHVSGVAHHSVKDDSACLALIRQKIAALPAPAATPARRSAASRWRRIRRRRR